MDRQCKDTGGVGNTVLGMTVEEFLSKDTEEVTQLILAGIRKRVEELERNHSKLLNELHNKIVYGKG